MTDDKGFSAGTMTLLFLSGAMIGAGVALLLAPQSGRQLQERLRQYGQRAQDSLHELVEQSSEAISQTVDKGEEFLQAKKSVVAEAIGATGDSLKKERERTSGSKKA